MNSETNSEAGLRHCCAIRSINSIELENRLERPAYWKPKSVLVRTYGSILNFAKSPIQGVKLA